MSLFDKLMGNASAVNLADLTTEFSAILIEDETIESAFAVFRDKWVFTNKRLILLNIQGVTGSKREYLTIPYRSVDRFSIETAGTLDDDCEMKLWIKGMQMPLVKEFKRSTDIKGLQRALASHILK
ncbi:MAG: PH domain-containing protein [Alistipes sp.]|nr:PH domain-containing protein [Alistipes sp.]